MPKDGIVCGALQPWPPCGVIIAQSSEKLQAGGQKAGIEDEKEEEEVWREL